MKLFLCLYSVVKCFKVFYIAPVLCSMYYVSNLSHSSYKVVHRPLVALFSSPMLHLWYQDYDVALRMVSIGLVQLSNNNWRG